MSIMLLGVPMYFVKRGDTYHDVAGADFRDLLAGRLSQMPGERATLSDWANHLSTIFPEVRLKRFLEMRGADMGPTSHVSALPALCAGLFYDAQALDAAGALVREWSAEDRAILRADVPVKALSATVAGCNLADVARDVLAIARGGLTRRARRDAQGRDESIYLAPLDAIVERRRTRADDLLSDFDGNWGGQVDPAFSACRLAVPAAAKAAA